MDDSELIDNHLHPQGKCDAVASLETLALHVIKLRISLLCAGGGISVLTKKNHAYQGRGIQVRISWRHCPCQRREIIPQKILTAEQAREVNDT